MLPWETIDRAPTTAGGELVLARRGDEWVVRVGGKVLMSSRAHGSEESLASESLKRTKVCNAVLIGGMGLGYTLRATLDLVQPKTRVVVSELVPQVVDWNRAHVGHLAGHPLADPRVEISTGDVRGCIAASPGAFDTIMLDCDNGPRPMAQPENLDLYGDVGIRACVDALRPRGVFALWSASKDGGYAKRLRQAGLEVEVMTVRARPGNRAEHVIFLGRKLKP